MTDQLFYTYTGKWSNDVLPTTRLYPDSIIFHEKTKRIIKDGKIYGSGFGNTYVVEGNSTGTAGTWTGTNEFITEYFNGLTIIYIVRIAGASTTTLNVNNLGACTCYLNATTKLTNQFPVDTPILFTYLDGNWTRADYNANTHYTTGLYIGEPGTQTSGILNNPFIKLFDDTTKRQEYRLIGEKGISVNSDVSGNVSFNNTAPLYLTTDAGSTVNGQWLASNTDITTLYDGLTIIYPITVAGASTTTIKINDLDAKTIYINGSTRLTTHYPIGQRIIITYSSNKDAWYCNNYWTDSNYLSGNYYTRLKIHANGYLSRYMIVGKCPDGTITGLSLTNNTTASTKTMYSGPLLLDQFYYYSTTTIYNANSNFTVNLALWDNYSLVDIRYTFNCINELTGMAYQPFYIVLYKGNDGYFYLDQDKPWQVGIPTTDSNTKIYVFLGTVYPDTIPYRISFEVVKKAYIRQDGILKEYGIDSDTYTTKIYNKNGENTSYNIVFSDKIYNNSETYAYVDSEINYNPFTNTLNVPYINSTLDLSATGIQGNISNIDRKVISNISFTNSRDITYVYSDSIGVSYFDGTSYLGEIFNDYDNNIATGQYSSAFGYSTISSNSYEVAFGSYNQPNNNQIFSIGIGDSSTNRKNAIWIDSFGCSYVNTIIPEGNKIYNIGSTSNRFNTIYADIFNGTSFTGTANKVLVNPNDNVNNIPIVGFNQSNSSKYLFYESNITFSNGGQLSITTGNNTAPLVVTSQKLVGNLNSDLLDGYHSDTLLEYAYLDSSITSPDLTYYIKIGGKAISGKQPIYAARLAGDTSYTAWGQVFWENGLPKNTDGSIIPGQSAQYSLGTSTKYWKDAFIKNIDTSGIKFNSASGIGSATNPIYWYNGQPTASNASVGAPNKPIYLSNGIFTECGKMLDVSINVGTANRIAWYSANDEISSGTITTDGSYLGAISNLTINDSHQITYKLLVNGTSMFKDRINIDSSSMGNNYHILFNRKSYNYITVPEGGQLAISIGSVGGANTRLTVDASSVYPGYFNNAINLGSSIYYWKKLFVKEIDTSTITFNNISGIGSATNLIYWFNGQPTASNASVGATNKPIYLNNGVFTECGRSLDVSVNVGIANRIAWYSANDEISSGTISTDGSYLGSVSYLSINNINQSSYRLLVNGNSMFKATMHIDSSGMGGTNHINFNRAEYNYINIPANGTFAISIGAAGHILSRLAVDKTSVFPGETDCSYDLGKSNRYWKKGYINEIDTSSISFRGTSGIGSASNLIYWYNGRPMASNASIGSSNRPIYLNNGIFTECGTLSEVAVNVGTKNRIAWYSANDAISSGTIATDGSYLASVSYLTVNSTNQSSYRLLVNGTSMFNNRINIDSSSMGGAVHINFNRTNYNYLNVPEGGTLAVSVNGSGVANTRLAVDASSVYPGYNNNTINLGTATYYWKKLFVKEIDTSRITFNNISGIGSATNLIYWYNGQPTASNASVGATNKPIYLNNGIFTECGRTLDVTINVGTANRIAWYSANDAISSGTITTNGSYLGAISYLSVNNDNQSSYRLLVNGNSMFKNIVNIDSSAMGQANHINFNRAGYNYINIPTGGTLGISINSATGANSRLAVDASAVYPGQNNNKIDLGTSTYYWKKAYIKEIDTSKITFNNTSGIGSATNLIYWYNGQPTASNASIGATNKPIYLNNGIFTECDSYDLYGLTQFTKSLTVTTSWTDTGISGTNIATGTYIIQMSVGGTIYYSGVVSWYSTSTNSSETDEIVLHASGNNLSERLYLKTTTTAKLQISCSPTSWTSAKQVVFKFKKII